jgi:hypothetical protein
MNFIKISVLLCNLFGTFCFLQNFSCKKEFATISQVKEINFSEVWDDGEVAWEIEPYHQSINVEKKTNTLPKKKKVNNNSDREKIWGLVEELRIQGVISGFIRTAYYNAEIHENLLNDLQNLQINPNMNIGKNFIANFNNEIDVIVTILTFTAYNNYNKTRIPLFVEKWKNDEKPNYYLEEFKKMKKLATAITLVIIIILCKNVKSAV